MADFSYGTSKLGKRFYDAYVVADTVAAPNFLGVGSFLSHAIRIGVMAANPKASAEKGEEIEVATGDKITQSENTTFDAKIYQVTKDNLAACRGLINLGVNIWLTDCKAATLNGTAVSVFASTASGTGTQLIKLESMYLYPGVEIIGNDQNTITISATKESGISTPALTISVEV